VATLIFVVVAIQFVLMGLFARTAIWRAGGFSALAALLVVYLLWQATDGAQTRTEAWLVLTSLPLVALGAIAWKQALGKLALALGSVLTVALLLTWRWAALSDAADPTTAIIIYASLVLVAMVALFMIAGVLAMRWLVERSRSPPAAGDSASVVRRK
jgi:hypothetical protein